MHFRRVALKAASLAFIAALNTPVLALDDSQSSEVSKPQVLNDSSNSERQIRALDRQAMLELIKLAEFNIRFQQSVNHYAPWRAIIYPAAQEATYASFLGYSLTDISQRGRGWNNPAIISPTSTKRALSAVTVGSLIGATSSLAELLADGAETLSAHKKGFSDRQSIAFVQQAIARIDQLISERHELMNQNSPGGDREELLNLKEQLLKYERDRLVYEFERWNAHSRGYSWYKNTFYIINFTVNMGRFTAIQLGFKSFTRPKCAGASGPTLIASACLAGVGPAVSSLVGKLREHHQSRLFSSKLPAKPFLSDEEAKQKFKRLAQLLASNDVPMSPLVSDLARLRQEKVGLDELIFHEDRKIARIRRVAGQQAIAAPVLSLMGAGSGILNSLAYYAYRQQPQISNKLNFVGDATIIPAEATALLLTPGAAILASMYERNLRKRNEHPEQLLSKRLAELNTLETIIKNTGN